MEILLWLVPAVVVTLVAMLAVGWWGREGRSTGVVDRDEAVRRLGEALGREGRRQPGYAVTPRDPEVSSGVALRATRSRPVVVQGSADEAARTEQPAASTDAAEPAASADDRAARDRRAS